MLTFAPSICALHCQSMTAIEYEKWSDHVVLIRLNRPQIKNAMTLAMFADISKGKYLQH